MIKIKNFLIRKNIKISVKRYAIEALGAMSLGLFSSLIIGLIIKVIGDYSHIPIITEVGLKAMSVVGAAIGISVAYGLQAPPLVLFSSAAVGMAGNEFGSIAGAFVSSVIGAEFGKMISKETKVDIIVTPLFTIVIGVVIAKLIGPYVNYLMIFIGNVIMYATDLLPIPMGIIVSVVMGMVLTLPISSAALAIMLNISGLAAGAATIGCSCQMIGFAVCSLKENGIGGLVSQGLGTSMLQMPNIVKNPKIWIPPTLASAILGPIGTTVLKMENIASGAGMGTSGLVGQVGTIEAMGVSSDVFIKIALLHFILPAVLSLIISEIMYKKGFIKKGDMKLDA
ncbi:PTS transporter subunit IIC [uncultured Brachyspira sp.]|uniref:PTS transporter subunit IIC n=1 Tax=uncultured Brachyspira sp. TaxID=221953 RepID=UPI0026008247|nr:PTS sugar transporter subunit IIC [uncultured Brachyspira sp.]